MKDKFFAKLAELVALAKDFPTAEFDEAAPEETTKHKLIRPLLKVLGYEDQNIVPEFKIVGDQVDYLLRSDRPLLFVEAKSLIDPAADLFEAHRAQVLGYIRNYRVSPEQAQMERPVTWIVLTNFLQWHFIRVTEEKPSFSFKLGELLARREELWELLARENAEAGRIEELYDQSHKAGLDKRFLADLKRWRLIIANAFALSNQTRSLDEITLASQQLLDRFIFCRMLETHRLIEYNKLARAYMHYDVVFGSFEGKTFAEFLRESLFQEIKFKFNTELFQQPLLCDQLAIDNEALAAVIGHEPLHAEMAAHCGIAVGQGELFPFRHLYLYDFSKMSQDIMGAVYERFLAHRLFQQDGRIVIEDTDELRKKEGIYYTPRYIVDYIVAHTLGEKVKPILAEAVALLGYKNFKEAFAKIRELGQIKVLDPAMGSGSFLLRAFDKLVDTYAEYNAACRKAKAERGNGSGMLFDAAAGIAEEVDHLGIRVATENIFGVDLDTQAIEVAKLNLWMRLMAVERDYIRGELQRRGKTTRPFNFLPNLHNNLRRGNSLIADKEIAGEGAFDWDKEFGDIMKRGGFDVVIGNPPYVFTRNQGFTDKEKSFFNSKYHHQSVQLNTFGLFIERANLTLCNGGSLGFITPNNWLTIDTFSPLRKFVLGEFGSVKLFNIIERVFDSADVDTAIVLFERRSPNKLVLGELSMGEAIFSREIELNAIKPPSLIIQIGLFKNQESLSLFEKIETGSKPLGHYATVSTGLKAYQTGKGKPPQTDDQKEARVFHSDKKKDDSFGKYLEGEDVRRYQLGWSGEFLSYGDWLAEPRKSVPFAGPRLLVRQIPSPPPHLIPATYTEEPFYNDINSMVVFGPKQGASLKFLLAVVNSRLVSFWFERKFDKMQRKIFPQFKVDELASFPVPLIDVSKSADKIKHDRLAGLSDQLITERQRQLNVPILVKKKVLHTLERVKCNLAHYLQKDFADAVQAEILIDDVQRKGLVHEIQVESAGPQITLSATVADDLKAAPRLVAVLRLTFQHEPLRQFIYALWRQFLEENSRKKKWTTGRKPEPVYPLLANTLEPLVYFQPDAVDNLRWSAT